MYLYEVNKYIIRVLNVATMYTSVVLLYMYFIINNKVNSISTTNSINIIVFQVI